MRSAARLPAIDDQRREPLVAREDRLERLPDRLHLRCRSAPGILGRVAGGQQQLVAVAQRDVELLGQVQDRVCFAWQLVGPDNGTSIARGVDFGLVAPDGRLAAVTGFLEQPA
jgi:hypothetical protein